jgi:hypothetical protein
LIKPKMIPWKFDSLKKWPDYAKLNEKKSKPKFFKSFFL